VTRATAAEALSLFTSLGSFWRDGSRMERIGYGVGAMLFVSGLLHLLILVMTRGSWYGPLSLRKPATFGRSFGLTQVTMVWVTTFLSIHRRTRTLLLSAFAAVHGVLMHAILALPGLAWSLSFSDWSERRRLAAVLLAAAGYAVVAGAIALDVGFG